MVGARARDTLHRGETLLLHDWRVRAEEQLAREIAELRQTGDRQVFVVNRVIVQQQLICLRTSQYDAESKVMV